MDVKCVIETVKSEKVWVNGKEYFVDADSVARNLPEEAARKLMESKHWINWSESAPVAKLYNVVLTAVVDEVALVRALRDQTEKSIKDAKTFLDDLPKVIEENLEFEKAEILANLIQESGGEASVISASRMSRPEPEPQPEENLEDTKEMSDEEVEDALEAPEEADGDEWPDPTEDMDIEYLREMADAYEVDYSDRTQAKTLVKKIKKAMYPDEE